MDEFGTLTESFGLKPQGKSAPMAASKGARSFGANSSRSVPNSSPIGGSFNGDYDGFFPSTTSRQPQNFGGLDDYDDVFGGPFKQTKSPDGRSGGSSFNYDSIFGGSNDSASKSSSLPYDDGIFDSVPGFRKSSASVKNDDFFASMTSPPTSNLQVDDLLGNFNKMGSELNGLSRKNSGEAKKTAAGFDDLISGFGGSSALKNGSSEKDPFVVLESFSASEEKVEMGNDEWLSTSKSPSFKKSDSTSPPSRIRPLRPPPGSIGSLNAEKKVNGGSSFPNYLDDLYSSKTAADANKSSVASSMDELEDFARGRVQNGAKNHSDIRSSAKAVRGEAAATQTNRQISGDDFESFFRAGVQTRSTSAPRPRTRASDPVLDTLFQKRREPDAAQSTSAEAAFRMKKDSFLTDIIDDFSFMSVVAVSSVEFQEIEGESEERRIARLKRHQETKERMAKAVADINQRDFQTQQEQEERHRIAETLNTEIKHWAAGKEGNLRALLSSLQLVLWPECGWQPVSLTDLITSASVKKVYKKATLYVHPDKVQQKGANIQQKYIAEKVFDLLKEAWNKFNSEEL
ncbi:auxilin-related protein 1 [Malania oleifera]|uniref:auxilin-related protein 1 n=1 Tax=Malania oleifera TaxID=397392 RepID=UPI0025ADC6D5|nr:auxilin-related protein 1 [Malania oleifera]